MRSFLDRLGDSDEMAIAIFLAQGLATTCCVAAAAMIVTAGFMMAVKAMLGWLLV